MPVATTAVQRTADTSTETSQAPAGGEETQVETPEDEGPPEVDKDKLAREVYQILKRRLIIEREQFWGV
jgi:hypothetical protein